MKQYFIIGGNGKEYGPVSESEVFEWIKEGRANGDTRIKETEAEEWSLIRNLEQFNLSTLPSNNPEDIPALPDASKAAQQNSFNDPDNYSHQKNYEARYFNVSPAAAWLCGGRWNAGNMYRGFEVYKNNIGEVSLLFSILLVILVVVGVISFLTLITAFVVSAVIAAIPVVGIILYLIFWTVLPILFLALFAPLTPGPLLFLVRLVRNEPARMEDIIAGYTRNGIQCVLAFLVQNVVYHIFVFLGGLLIILATGWPFIKLLIEAAKAGTGNPPTGVPELGITFFAGNIIGLLIMVIPMTYLGISWAYSMILIVDRKMNFWPAMELSRKTITKHWFRIFLFFIEIGCLAFLGIFFCGLGLFVTIPLAMTMLAASYVHIFDEQVFERGAQR
jgi:hypothetical protein